MMVDFARPRSIVKFQPQIIETRRVKIGYASRINIFGILNSQFTNVSVLESIHSGETNTSNH